VSGPVSDSGAVPTAGVRGQRAPFLIEGRGLRRVFSTGGVDTVALASVDLAIRHGEMLAIIGPSGSGKSTLMALLGCLDRPTGGTYLLEGHDVTHLSDDDLSAVRNKTIGFVFQSFHLLPRSTARENVELPLIYAGVPRRERRLRSKALLESVGLGHRLDHRPNQMSGGENQRVAIARALVNDPGLILADEPTGNLDSRSGTEILGLFTRLNRERGVSVILVTHDPRVAEQCDRVIEIFDGLVVRDSRKGDAPSQGGAA
jgi:putative ABC transport system ATP-binding protein